MSNGATDNRNVAAWVVGAISALGGFLTLVATFFYLIRSYVSLGDGLAQNGGAPQRWQALGMLAVAVGIAFAVAAMLRFSLSPLTGQKRAAATAAAIPTDPNAELRGHIATVVLLIGSGAIVGLATVLIVAFAVLAWWGGFTSLQDKMDTLLTGVFSTVLPVLATWVGTVLAFYFGSENFRQAAQNTREALSDRLTPARKITDVMIPYERIAKLEVNGKSGAEDKLITDVIHTMSEAAPRVILFDKETQSPIYIIRSSVPPMPPTWIASNYQEGPEAKDKTVKQYLAFSSGNQSDAENFRFIKPDATPEEALAQLAREGVDDLFVTGDGQKTSRVLGWIAAHDLMKR